MSKFNLYHVELGLDICASTNFRPRLHLCLHISNLFMLSLHKLVFVLSQCFVFHPCLSPLEISNRCVHSVDNIALFLVSVQENNRTKGHKLP